MGDRPIPAGIRALRGGRTRPHHHDVVPEADRPDALPPVEPGVAPPADLAPEQHRYWNEFAPILASAKMLTPADTQTLCDYCRCCYWVKTLEGDLLLARETKPRDWSVIRILDSQVRGWTEKKTKLAGELGLTAIARTRTSWTGHGAKVDPPGRPTTKIAQFQARARKLRQQGK